MTTKKDKTANKDTRIGYVAVSELVDGQSISDKFGHCAKMFKERQEPSADPEKEAREQHERQRKLLAHRGVPIKYIKELLDLGQRPTDALQKAKAWARTTLPKIHDARAEKGKMPRRSSPVFFGLPGRGKTHAAAWLILQEPGDMLEDDTPPMWIRASTYVNYKFSRKNDHNEIADKALTSSFLVLDDFGREANGAGGHAAAHISDLLFEREESERTTVITVNLAEVKVAPDLKGQDWLHAVVNERYNPALASRLCSNFALFECGGPDLRVAMEHEQERALPHHSPSRSAAASRALKYP